MKTLLRFLCLSSLALAALAARAETYALMIGICDYPDVVDASGKPVMDKDTGKPMTNDLSGCVNDVKSYDELLESKFGLKKGNVKMLLDKDANEEGFVKGVKWLLNAAKPGDQVLFFYSGHGTQFPSKEEADGTQEAIVLADMTFVDGDLFHKLSQALGRMGTNATFVFDSCFSGGMSRDATMPLKGRSVKVHKKYLDAGDLKGMGKTKRFSAAKAAALRAIPRAKGAAQGGSFAFVAASSDKETSADLKFKDDKYPAHGLFTFLMLDALQNTPDLGVEAMVKAVANDIHEAKFTQSPTTEFSSETRAARPLYLKD